MTVFEYSLRHRPGLAASILAAFLVLVSSCAAPSGGGGALRYRGFIVDMSADRGDLNFASIENSVKHQIDIVADCHVKPEIMEAFRATPIALTHGLKNEPGQFVPGRGVDIEAEVMPPQQPILLHELLHAYHFNKLPGGDRNPDVATFYERARGGHFLSLDRDP